MGCDPSVSQVKKGEKGGRAFSLEVSHVPRLQVLLCGYISDDARPHLVPRGLGLVVVLLAVLATLSFPMTLLRGQQEEGRKKGEEGSLLPPRASAVHLKTITEEIEEVNKGARLREDQE